MACRRCNPSPQVTGRGEGVQDNTTTSAPSFQNDFLKVTLQSISKSPERRSGYPRVNLVFTLENISNEDIFIARQGSGRSPVSLVGNQGSKWYLDEFNGISSMVTGAYAGSADSGYSMFSPGSKNTIVLAFRSSSRSEDTSFSFSANMYRLVNKSTTRFSIGISNMRITQ